MSNERTNVLSWDETFMRIAETVKLRSKDPVTQVGACIVSNDRRILSLGYNGAPNGFPDDMFPWGKEGKYLETKHPYVVHAERNAILNFRGSLREFAGASIYVTRYPCNECAKEIIQTGIKEIIYSGVLNLRKDSIAASQRMLNITGIQVRSL